MVELVDELYISDGNSKMLDFEECLMHKKIRQ